MSNEKKFDISKKEFYDISRNLEVHHAIFYKVWEMGKPVFTKSIETAAVQFNKEGDLLLFLFNPDFWQSLNDYERTFVISHEALHVILNHGVRTRSTDNPILCNIALDLVVNHTLVEKFRFEREKIRNYKQYCWVDTVFDEKTKIHEDKKYFEYYFNLLNKNKLNLSNVKLVDIHGSFGNKNEDGNKEEEKQESFSSIYEDQLKDIIEELDQNLSDIEKQQAGEVLKEHLQQECCDDKQNGGLLAGTGAGSWMNVEIGEVKKKKKWETVIKKWSLQFKKTHINNLEQWARKNRRLAFLDGELMLPSEMEEEKKKEDKIIVYFFLDTSGSCIDYKERFLKAARSLPSDKFEIRGFYFDTRVVEVDLERTNKVYGGWGTYFSIIENKIQNIIFSEKKEYPKAVFMITDGYGDNVYPQIPENWYVFLTPYSSKYCFPDKVNFFQLKDYE